MGHKNREIEVKLLVGGDGVSWGEVVRDLESLLGTRPVRVIKDTSTDDYWKPPRLGEKKRVNFISLGGGGGGVEVAVFAAGDTVSTGKNGTTKTAKKAEGEILTSSPMNMTTASSHPRGESEEGLAAAAGRLTVDDGNQARALFKTLLPQKPEEAPVPDFVRIRCEEGKAGRSTVTVKARDCGGNFNRIEIDMLVDGRGEAESFLTALLGKKEGSITKRYNVYFLDEMETNVSAYQIAGSPLVFLEVEAQTVARVVGLCELLVGRLGRPLSRVENSLYDMFICGQEPRLRSLTPAAEPLVRGWFKKQLID